ncbi:uncharacterized protein [Chiloscyllium punctatum]|uniref:uncharacterized protein isoform X2 n=1 Tax=Chiloscyllium punctatum TaxID=137246 RepID=UPI003B641444
MDEREAEMERRFRKQETLLRTRSERIQELEGKLQKVCYELRGPRGAERNRKGRGIGTQRRTEGSLLVVHIHQATLALPELADEETFCTLTLQGFETQLTPLTHGQCPLFDFTSEYPLCLGKFLTHSVNVEMHHALGDQFQTLAWAQIPILEGFHTLHGAVPLNGVDGSCGPVGELEYSIGMYEESQEQSDFGDGRPLEIPIPVGQHQARHHYQVRSQEPGKAAPTGRELSKQRRTSNSGWGTVSPRAASQTENDSGGTDATSSGSDELVQSLLGAPSLPAQERMRIEVVSLSLSPGSRAAMDAAVEQLYVEYHIPGMPLALTETPVSLRKPYPGERVHYHSSQVIPLHPQRNPNQRDFFLSLIEGTEPHSGSPGIRPGVRQDWEACRDRGRVCRPPFPGCRLPGRSCGRRLCCARSQEEAQPWVRRCHCSRERRPLAAVSPEIVTARKGEPP